jgi:hypothetical protein
VNQAAVAWPSLCHNYYRGCYPKYTKLNVRCLPTTRNHVIKEDNYPSFSLIKGPSENIIP